MKRWKRKSDGEWLCGIDAVAAGEWRRSRKSI